MLVSCLVRFVYQVIQLLGLREDRKCDYTFVMQLDICGNNQFFEINSIFILATYTISKDKVYKGFQKYIDASFVFILFFFVRGGVFMEFIKYMGFISCIRSL